MQIKNPDLVNLKTCFMQQIGQVTWQAATFFMFYLSVIEAFWICFTMQFSHMQSPQYKTLGKFPAFPVIGSLSVYSELQITQRLKSPPTRKVSSRYRFPPKLAWDTGSNPSISSSGGGLLFGTIKSVKFCYKISYCKYYSSSNNYLNSDS